MKEGARILGVDDASFSFEDEKTFLTGVVYRGTEFIEDIKTVPIKVDAENATEKLIELHNSCNNPEQIKAVLTDGISFAGFNIIDLEKASKELEKPVIAVTKNRPDREDFRETMERTGNYDEKFEALDEPVKVELEDGEAFIQFSGCNGEEAKEIVKTSIIHGQVPEPVRVADLIGSGTTPLKEL
ncbi:MAG: DUF99 family protein [Candidatus Nanohalobium sp.]